VQAGAQLKPHSLAMPQNWPGPSGSAACVEEDSCPLSVWDIKPPVPYFYKTCKRIWLVLDTSFLKLCPFFCGKGHFLRHLTKSFPSVLHTALEARQIF